jgi:hypothetical protein
MTTAGAHPNNRTTLKLGINHPKIIAFLFIETPTDFVLLYMKI